MGKKDTPVVVATPLDTEAEQPPYEAVGKFEVDYPKLCEKHEAFAVQVNIIRSESEPLAADEENKTIVRPFNGPPSIDLCLNDDIEPVSVRISGWPLETPMARALMESCEALSSITNIFFCNAGLTDESLGLLIQSFSPDSTIVALHIHNNQSGNKGISQQTFQRLISPCTTKVDTLSIRDAGDVIVSVGVMKSPLRSLTLRYCGVDDDGAKSIASALRDNHVLTCLNLHGNHISDNGAASLIRAIRVNRTLRALSLGRNALSDVTAVQLAEAVMDFCLTHDEVVCRRRLLLEPNVETDTSADDLNKTKGRQTTSSRVIKSSSKIKVSSGKEARGTSGKSKNKGGKGAKGAKGNVEEEEEVVRKHPFLDASVKTTGGPIMCDGNNTLVSINLAYNRITSVGVEKLLNALKLQTLDADLKNCILHLQVQGNTLAHDHVLLIELEKLLAKRNLPLQETPFST